MVETKERGLLDKLATKKDVRELGEVFSARMDLSEQKLAHQTRTMTLLARQTIGLGSIAVVAIGILYTLIKLT